MKPDYGNWVPKRLLYGLLIAVLITTALLIGALVAGWAWPWMVLVAILLVVSAGFLCYMTVLYHVFSFSGGGLMGRVHEYVANHLPWDGRGRLLRETLRVLKPGGSFALQDLFGQKSTYGDFQGLRERLQTDTVSEIHYADSATEIPIPKWLRVSGMMPGVGIIYGKK